MRRLARFLVLIALFGCFSSSICVAAATNPYGYWQTYTYNGVQYKTVRCTWYAWQQAYDRLGVALPGWGNGGTWLGSAKAAGYQTGSEARPNSIAVWEEPGAWGHCAFVVSVEGNTMTVNEGGMYQHPTGWDGRSGVGATIGSYRNGTGTLIGFIYLTDNEETIPPGSEMPIGYDRTIPDGDYQIVSFKNPGFQLDIAGNDVPAANSANVQLWEVGDDVRRQDVFTLTYDANDKFYSIIQKDTKMALDVVNGSVVAGENVQIYESHGGSPQRWAISEALDDAGNWIGYRIQAKCSGFSLDIVNGGEDSAYANGTNVQQYPGNNSQAQSWLFIPYEPAHTLPDGRYILVSGLDADLELDVAGDTPNVENGVNVQIWNDNNAEFRTKALSQYNSFDVKYYGNGYYKLYHGGSGKALDVDGASKNQNVNVQLWEALDDSLAQQWAITPLNSGYALRARCSGLALDVKDGLTTDGINVQQHTYNSSLAQTWYFVPAEYAIKYDSNGGHGAPVEQLKYYKGDLKLTEVKPTRSGYIFDGWATNKNASRGQYLAGSIYSADESATLYAIWYDEKDLRDAPPFGENDPEQNQISLSASLNTDGKLTVLINVPSTASPPPATLIAGLYDHEGRMLEVQSVQTALASGDIAMQDIFFESNVLPNMTAKLFLVDKNVFAPLCESTEVNPANIIYLSQLEDNSVNNFQEDTQLILDTVKSVQEVSGNKLTVRGDGTLYAYHINIKNLYIEGGTIREITDAEEYETSSEYSNYIAEFISADTMTVKDGTIILERSSGRCCIQASSLIVLGGKIVANSNMCAICSGEMNISGGEVYAYSNFVGLGGPGSWSGSISGCNLSVSGGILEARGLLKDGSSFTVGAALSKLTMEGGTFISSGSLTALNCWDEPIMINPSVNIIPEGAYASNEETTTNQSRYGWTGYSFLNIDESRVTELVLTSSM